MRYPTFIVRRHDTAPHDVIDVMLDGELAGTIYPRSDGDIRFLTKHSVRIIAACPTKPEYTVADLEGRSAIDPAQIELVITLHLHRLGEGPESEGNLKKNFPGLRRGRSMRGAVPSRPAPAPIVEHFEHDACPKCGTPSVPWERVPDQALRGCPKCEHQWQE